MNKSMKYRYYRYYCGLFRLWREYGESDAPIKADLRIELNRQCEETINDYINFPIGDDYLLAFCHAASLYTPKMLQTIAFLLCKKTETKPKIISMRIWEFFYKRGINLQKLGR